jgi:hypothetical protein
MKFPYLDYDKLTAKKSGKQLCITKKLLSFNSCYCGQAVRGGSTTALQIWGQIGGSFFLLKLV